MTDQIECGIDGRRHVWNVQTKFGASRRRLHDPPQGRLPGRAALLRVRAAERQQVLAIGYGRRPAAQEAAVLVGVVLAVGGAGCAEPQAADQLALRAASTAACRPGNSSAPVRRSRLEPQVVLHLNAFLYSLMKARNRQEFLADERKYSQEVSEIRTDAQREAVVNRAWNRLLELGGSLVRGCEARVYGHPSGLRKFRRSNTCATPAPRLSSS